MFDGTDTTDASHFYLILGVVGLSVYFGLGFARKIANEIAMLIFGFMLIGAGLITLAVVERENLNKIQVRRRVRASSLLPACSAVCRVCFVLWCGP